MQHIRHSVACELAHTETIITKHIDSNVSLLNDVKNNIIVSGGKRLRPLLLLLSAKACGYSGNDNTHLAAVIELIQTATLLHDDVIDNSDLRRGNPTANSLWDNTIAILSGDFLYAKSFQIMLDHASRKIMHLLTNTYSTIVEGEMIQLLSAKNSDMTEAEYYTIIGAKTAQLFATAAKIGAMLAESEHADALQQFGKHFGLAFQLIDDLLDYVGKSDAHLGKKLGDDLEEGKVTLPIIYALQHATATEQEVIKKALSNGNRNVLNSVAAILHSSGAIAYTAECAQKEIQLALAAIANLPETTASLALQKLARYLGERSF